MARHQAQEAKNKKTLEKGALEFNINEQRSIALNFIQDYIQTKLPDGWTMNNLRVGMQMGTCDIFQHIRIRELENMDSYLKNAAWKALRVNKPKYGNNYSIVDRTGQKLYHGMLTLFDQKKLTEHLRTLSATGTPEEKRFAMVFLKDDYVVGMLDDSTKVRFAANKLKEKEDEDT